ncbi:MAG TPA: hypothetical protein PKY30_03645 [Myxococcota bacterium]|nr:hypothetical protein [Myxococcota bacterium]
MSTRLIGLSLGADLCWPACFEEIVKRLSLKLELGSETVDFAVERVRIEPYNIRYQPRYDMVIDRITHWFPMTREWVKKIQVMDGVYVLNNPWMIQAAEKHTTYCAMARLGFPVPETWIIPPKAYPDQGDVPFTTRSYNNLFKLEDIGDSVGYPAFLKPYDGGAWRGVSRVKDHQSLHRSYNESGEQVMHLQKAVDPWDIFVRGIGIGPQVNVIKYNPDAPLHGRYEVAFNFLSGEEWQTQARYVRVINAFFCWDYNSCESLRKGGILYPIDFANACPDSQITSLHFHFPWMVRAMVKWSLYCAATRRKPRMNPNWQPYFDIADQDIPFSEKLEAYDALARDHFETEKFEAFCEKYLGHVDEVCLEFFGTGECLEIFRKKVAHLYPKHEIDEFTNHFFGLVQFWRKTESEKLARAQAAEAGVQSAV